MPLPPPSPITIRLPLAARPPCHFSFSMPPCCHAAIAPAALSRCLPPCRCFRRYHIAAIAAACQRRATRHASATLARRTAAPDGSRTGDSTDDAPKIFSTGTMRIFRESAAKHAPSRELAHVERAMSARRCIRGALIRGQFSPLPAYVALRLIRIFHAATCPVMRLRP